MTGAATSVDRLDRNVAPANAPTAPGMPIFATTFQSTLPKRQCENPDASVVPISARCTVADAAAGFVPIASSSVVEVTPYAMPRLPSTSLGTEAHQREEEQLSHGGVQSVAGAGDGHHPQPDKISQR